MLDLIDHYLNLSVNLPASHLLSIHITSVSQPDHTVSPLSTAPAVLASHHFKVLGISLNTIFPPSGLAVHAREYSTLLSKVSKIFLVSVWHPENLICQGYVWGSLVFGCTSMAAPCKAGNRLALPACPCLPPCEPFSFAS